MLGRLFRDSSERDEESDAPIPARAWFLRIVSRHCPKHIRLLLMLPASLRRGPVEISVLEIRSLPARSTMLRRDTEYLRESPALSLLANSTLVFSRRILIVKTLCERELDWFAIVPKTERFS